MPSTRAELLEGARQLPVAQRAQLVENILQTLDEPDPAVDADWREEAERRVEGMHDGSRTANPWSQVRAGLGL